MTALTFGGAQWDALNLASGFSQLGYEVDFLLGKKTGELVKEIPDSVRVMELGSARSSRCILPMARYLRREKPLALVTTLTEQNLTGILAKQLARCRTLTIARECNTMSVHAGNTPGFKARYFPIPARIILPYADMVVGNSQGVVEDLLSRQGLPKRRLRVIYNPALRPEVPALAEEDPHHPWLDDAGPPVIIGVGRLTKQKDFPTLIRAFAKARRDRPMRLIILGEGEDRESLEALIRDLGVVKDVRLPGFVDNPYAYLSRASTFVLSSAWEGLGNVVIEALACGTQVVSCDCRSGPREILENGRFGRLVPVGDYDGMAEAVIRSLDEPLPSEMLKQAAERFSIRQICLQYQSLFEELASGSGIAGSR